MSEVITGIIVSKVIDYALTAFVAGIERGAIVEKIRAMEEAGASADDMTDALQAMRQEQEAKTQAKLDLMPE